MKDRTILVWDTGFETDWRVRVTTEMPEADGYRSVTGWLQLASGEAFVANYDTLTMAAQFEDYSLPDDHCSRYRVVLGAGLYEVRIIQVVEPRAYFVTSGSEADNRPPEFIIALRLTHTGQPPWTSVPWSTLTDE